MESASFLERFRAYFRAAPAVQAARSLSNGVEIEFHVGTAEAAALETFHFTKKGGEPAVLAGPARDPQLSFRMTPLAAEAILTDPEQDIARIGIQIMKQVASSDPERKVSVKFHAGFLTLMSKGYLGVLASGGAGFAAYLASRGLGGVNGLKAAINKARESR